MLISMNTGFAENPSVLEELEDPTMKQMYQFACDQALSVLNTTFGYMLSQDLLLDDACTSSINQLRSMMPNQAVIMLLSDAWNDRESLLDCNDEEKYLIKSALCFSPLISINTTDSWGQGVALDYLSIYKNAQIETFRNVGYVILRYDRDLPLMITAFCETNEDSIITKTGIVYSKNMPFIFSELVGSLTSIWGDEYLDIYLYNS